MTKKSTTELVHTCHWPGCEVEVEPKFWGCKPHWFALPKRLRDLIWLHYRRGQEVTKRPSAEYIAAAQLVQAWIIEQTKMHQARAKKALPR